jgi:hypothetical protein
MINFLILVCDIVYWIAFAVKPLAEAAGELLRLYQKRKKGDERKKAKAESD